MNLDHWIRDNTDGCNSVVEFGSMFFYRLSCVHPSCVKRIGIEIHKPYIDAATFQDCIKIHGNVFDFEKLVDPKDMDCAMIVDVLEHFERDKAFELVSRIKSKFNRLILMVPEGNHPQTSDAFGMGADEFQTHRSTWRVKDVEELGFDKIEVDPNFHKSFGKDSGCIFAVWNKKK